MPRSRLAALACALVLALTAAPALAAGPYSAANLTGVWLFEADSGTGGAIAFIRQDERTAVVKAFSDYAIDEIYAMEGRATVSADGAVEIDLKFMSETHQNEFTVQDRCRGKFIASDRIELNVDMDYTSANGTRKFQRTWKMQRVPADKLPKAVREKFDLKS
ncbi:MAG: hypothetical protein V1797_05100 [Pseudomonadota bacterium]